MLAYPTSRRSAAAAESQRRAAQATEEGRFESEIVPVPTIRIRDHEDEQDADRETADHRRQEKVSGTNGINEL